MFPSIDEYLRGISVQDEAKLQRGRALFQKDLSGCHGVIHVAGPAPVKGQQAFHEIITEAAVVVPVGRKANHEGPAVSFLLLPYPDRHVKAPALNTIQGYAAADDNPFLPDRTGPVALQFPYRLLEQAAPADRDLSGQGHHTEPQIVILPYSGILPSLHPGDHDPAPVRSQHGLGGVKIIAIIHRVNRFTYETMIFTVITAGQYQVAVPVLKFTGRFHLLG